MIEPLHDYINIDVQRLKENGYYKQDIELYNGNFEFTFHYNEIDKSFTVDIADNDGLIYAGEKMILDQPLWRGINQPRLPPETLIPLSNNYDIRIDLGNLNQSVFLCIDDLPD